jgi:hypothetical protein
MQTILIVLGILGLGAVVISAYVFTVAARNYVTEKNQTNDGEVHDEKLFVVRTQPERRDSTDQTGFPLTLDDGTVITDERRKGERRRS